MEHIDAIIKICDAISVRNLDQAKSIATIEWPFEPNIKRERKMTPKQLMALWDRDGYIDRYSGERLIFPGTLHLLSRLLPEELPYHKNGKFEECHFMHWELYPSQDHVIPVARGGSIELDNIVTTSMMRNQIKANWLLDEVGWTLKPPGKLTDWDGLKGWFLKMYSSHSEVINNDRGLKKWRELALIGHPYA